MYRSNSAVDSTQLCTEPSRVLPACATISHTSSPLTPAAGCAAAPVAALFCGCSCSASGANGSESGARASSASQAGSALDSASAPVKGVRLLRREKTMELPRCTWLWSGVSVDAGMEVRERKPMSCCSAGSLAVPPTLTLRRSSTSNSSCPSCSTGRSRAACSNSVASMGGDPPAGATSWDRMRRPTAPALSPPLPAPAVSAIGAAGESATDRAAAGSA
mmetsp:Transcript_3031/g.8278  ORF Transcript_3031/g.8278 Transcript_3031/m.8278 type:complete len:219 (+) Transcript_3031:619-1275(+)